MVLLFYLQLRLVSGWGLHETETSAALMDP